MRYRELDGTDISPPARPFTQELDKPIELRWTRLWTPLLPFLV
jgi:hypothetical protein